MDLPEGYILIKKSGYEDILVRLLNLEQENADLKRRLNLNSGNSHKPPSTEGYSKKPVVKNNRVRGDKKRGGQPGNPGRTLLMTDLPDHLVEVGVYGKCECGRAIEEGKLTGFNRSQVIDVVPKLVETTEYRGLIRQCKCGRVHQGRAGTPGIRYGNGIKALAFYLSQYQLIPYIT